jgi:hypothetical protein
MEIERTPLAEFVRGKANGFSSKGYLERALKLLENPPQGALDPFSLGLIAGYLQRQRFEAALPPNAVKKRFYRELRNSGMDPKHARLIQRGHFGLYRNAENTLGNKS